MVVVVVPPADADELSASQAALAFFLLSLMVVSSESVVVTPDVVTEVVHKHVRSFLHEVKENNTRTAKIPIIVFMITWF